MFMWFFFGLVLSFSGRVELLNDADFNIVFLLQAYIEKEDSKKLKQKQRERMQPKMGKMDIDYQVSVYYISHQSWDSCFNAVCNVLLRRLLSVF